MVDYASLLGDEAEQLLSHVSKGIPKEDLILPGPDFIDRVMVETDRSPQVLRNLAALYGSGRLGRHRVRVDPAGRPGHRALRRGQLRAQPPLLRPGNIVELAIEGGCNAVATTFGVLGCRQPRATRTASRSSSSSTTTSC